jgi:hypothetical protein
MYYTSTCRDTATTDDLGALVRMNEDYIHSLKASNANRFREILANDLLCAGRRHDG